MTSTSLSMRLKASGRPLVVGTLAETQATTSRWGKEPSSEEIQRMRRDELLNKHESLLRHLKRKLALAKMKAKKAKTVLAKVQEKRIPVELPSDLEIISDEERFLFCKIGLSMKPFLHVPKNSYSGKMQIIGNTRAESGGVLISLDRNTKGYAVILYCGKNYQRPVAVRPRTLLTRQQALARSIELQRREDEGEEAYLKVYDSGGEDSCSSTESPVQY